jgi:DNA-directed DNA polymerase III PolC
MFVHLHTHSYYSFLEGLASPAALAQAAAQNSMPALALTDHHWLSGAVEFYDACREAGIQPVLGLELDVGAPEDLTSMTASPAPLLLLATSLEGWRGLCRLSSAVLDEQERASTALPFERLRQETEGLICLTGGRRGLAARLAAAGDRPQAGALLERLREAFPGRLYVELQRHAPEDRAWVESLTALARERRLPLVATHNVYYLDAGQSRLQRLAAAIRLNTSLSELPAGAAAPPGAHFLGQEEMAARFADLPEALEATTEIAAQCRLELPLGVAHFPEVSLPEGISPGGSLRQRAEQGARRIYLGATASSSEQNGGASELPGEIRRRLDHELEVIERFGYASLFLIMEEIMAYARQSGVPTSSRGSAASSLVAHCLGITSPDPLRLNLYFERFLNPARATPPDIDTDLCSRRRDGVIDFVYRRFGAERVAMVCTISRFRRRSALREVAKAHGLPPAEVSELAEGLPQRWYGPPERAAAGESPYAELAGRFPAARYQAIFQDAAALIGVPDHLSVHPGGVVIAPGPLTDLAPTHMAAKGVRVTQLDLDSIARLGLVKIDLLGIRGLTVLGDVAEHCIKEQIDHEAGGSERPRGEAALEFLEGIPDGEPATAECVRTGRTIGCFQIESPGMRATLQEIQARSVDDVMAALALYRPGPLTGGLKDAFVRRHKGQEAIEHLHPALAPLLEDTYGVILYQEQVLRIAHELGGLSLADSDLLRRAMSHFDPGKQMQTLKEKFVAGAYQRSGVPEAVAERVWELMAAFAGYGFPKAHAASYALVSWRAAWCKVHHPAIFMAAVLANWGGYYSQRVYLSEARRMGLSLRPPHVNYARQEFSVSYLDGQPLLFMGLDQVRELTRRTQALIQRQRPFHSFEDFLAQVDPRPVEAENLARAGALEGLGSIPALLRRLQAGGGGGGQLPLFSTVETEAEDLPLAEKAAHQEAVLGASLVAHPLELAAEQVVASGAVTTAEAAGRIGQRLRVAGMRQFWRRSLAQRGGYVYFMSLEDLEGMLDVVIEAGVYRRSRSALTGHGPYIVEGVVELNAARGEPLLRAERIWGVQAYG